MGACHVSLGAHTRPPSRPPARAWSTYVDTAAVVAPDTVQPLRTCPVAVAVFRSRPAAARDRCPSAGTPAGTHRVNAAGSLHPSSGTACPVLCHAVATPRLALYSTATGAAQCSVNAVQHGYRRSAAQCSVSAVRHGAWHARPPDPGGVADSARRARRVMVPRTIGRCRHARTDGWTDGRTNRVHDASGSARRGSAPRTLRRDDGTGRRRTLSVDSMTPDGVADRVHYAALRAGPTPRSKLPRLLHAACRTGALIESSHAMYTIYKTVLAKMYRRSPLLLLVVDVGSLLVAYLCVRQANRLTSTPTVRSRSPRQYPRRASPPRIPRPGRPGPPTCL